MNTIYQKLKRIAKPVVKSYQTDLTCHDRADLAHMQTGDVSVWVPREMGTHLIHVKQHDDTPSHETRTQVSRALMWFDAITKQGETSRDYDEMQWYLLESTSGRYGHVCAIDAAAARKLFTDRISALEPSW